MPDMMVKTYIKELFATMSPEVSKMVNNSMSSEKATEDIIRYVSSKIASASRGYMATIYSTLSDETLKEPIFQDLDHSNKFFDLELDKKIVEAYKFDIKELPTFNKRFDVKEINRAYTTAVTGVGTAAVGGVLLGVLSGLVGISIIRIIAGAVLAGLVGSGVAYFKVVPDINKQRFLEAAEVFMKNLESEMYHWVDGVIDFYNAKVEELKMTF